VSQTRERAITKEHSTQSKVVDLETQLSRTTTELTTLRRSKEEVRESVLEIYISSVNSDYNLS
jgi:hypothetical protein